MSISGDRAMDEGWVLFFESLVASAKALHHPGPKAIDEHVCISHQSEECGYAICVFKVQSQGAFVAVVAEVKGGYAVLIKRRCEADVIAAQRFFYFDDIRPHIGEHQCALPAGQQAAQV